MKVRRQAGAFGALLVCVAGCSAGKATSEVTANPTRQDLIDALTNTYQHNRVRFVYTVVGAPGGPVDYQGIVDLAHDAGDLTNAVVGAGGLEERFTAHGEWAKGAVSTSPQTWVISPQRGDFERNLKQTLPAATATQIPDGGTQADRVGSSNIDGTPTIGYQWTSPIADSLLAQARLPAGDSGTVELQIDSEGRVHEMQIVLTEERHGSPASTPPSSASPAPATPRLMLVLSGFGTAPAIAAPPNPVTVQQLNNEQ
jgi:hypothetical protein